MNSPKEIAVAYCAAGEAKAKLPVYKTFILAIFAGFFIALAGAGSTVAAATVENPSLAKFLSACIFPAGLLMVLIAGSELFTGNCLLIIPVLCRKIKIRAMIKNLIVVVIGNFIGSVIIAFLCSYGGVFALFNEAVAKTVVNTAAAKCNIPFVQAVIKGILCNFMVCLAVWMSFGAKTVSGKLAALFFPILIFVACGFEHNVANMFYIPAGLFTVSNGAYTAINAVDGLNWANFIVKNLIPVTIGNIIGGAGLIGAGYWTVYLKDLEK